MKFPVYIIIIFGALFSCCDKTNSQKKISDVPVSVADSAHQRDTPSDEYTRVESTEPAEDSVPDEITDKVPSTEISPRSDTPIDSLEARLRAAGLVDVQSMERDIRVDLRYSSTRNFLERDVYGSLERAYLQPEAAERLADAQGRLEKLEPGFSLLVYDAVRPRSVQYKMWDIVAGTPQQSYVANPRGGSIHNYGAAVDLTIADSDGRPIDMGTDFDFFGNLAQPRYEEQFLQQGKLTQTQIDNRRLLRRVMNEAGFHGILNEWWHFNAFSRTEIRRRYKMIE